MNWHRKPAAVAAIIVTLGLGVGILGSCGGDDGSPVEPGNGNHPSGPDTTAPAAVTDLRLRSATQNTLALVWTAPGDDGATGTASHYDIRFSKSLIDAADWDDAAPIDSALVPDPKPAGRIETVVVTGLESGTMYYFALKTSDEVPNVSGMSNCCGKATQTETMPPSDITDLRAIALDVTTFELTWTAPGDDYMKGTAAQYDIRYSLRPIEDDEDWGRAIPASDPPAPEVAGTTQSLTVTGLTGRNYFFAIKTVDELSNWSGLSNLALGLGYNEDLFIFPTSISRGNKQYIAYRAAEGEETRISLHPYYVRHYCGEQVIIDLVRGTLAPGVYSLEFDFIDPKTNDYVDPGMYGMSLCWGTDMQTWEYVSTYE